MLLVREINSLKETPTTLEKEIEAEKAICLSEELQRFEVQVFKTGSGPGGTQRTIQLSAKFNF